MTPPRRTGAGRSLPALSAVFFVASAKSNVRSIVNWQEWRDSNPRPTVLETAALPTELHSFRQKPTRRRAFWLASADHGLRRGNGGLSAGPLPRKVNSERIGVVSRPFGRPLPLVISPPQWKPHESPRPGARRLARAFSRGLRPGLGHGHIAAIVPGRLRTRGFSRRSRRGGQTWSPVG